MALQHSGQPVADAGTHVGLAVIVSEIVKDDFEEMINVFTEAD